MSDKRNRTRTESGQTGEMPPVSEPGMPAEPPMPEILPEFSATESATGRFRILAEGEDDTRQQDDSASRPDASAPAAHSAK